VALLSERWQYVKEWIRILNATVFVEAKRNYNQFMFAGRCWRMIRDILARRLGVRYVDDLVYLHTLAYGDAKAPCRAHEAIFPPEGEVRVLFTEPFLSFLSGTLRIPDRLTPVAYTIHMALRSSRMLL
jgi:hypothetical protein